MGVQPSTYPRQVGIDNIGKEILYIYSWNYGEELKKVNKVELSQGCRCDLELPWGIENLLEGNWRQYNPGQKSDI